MECYNCHKLGHFQWKCQSKEKEESYAETQEKMLLMTYVNMNKANREDMWFLDSGCSNHMCGKKEYFSDFDGSFRDLVKLGNNSSMVVMGKGNVRLQVNGIILIITGVFYVPELKNNLLSIGKLQAKGLSILFQNGTCKVFHLERRLIMETKMSLYRMFVLHAISQPVATVQTQLKLMGSSVSRSPSYTPRSKSYRHGRRSRRDPSPSPIIPLLVLGEGAIQVPSATDAEVGLPHYLLSPNRLVLVLVLVVHPLIGNIP